MAGFIVGYPTKDNGFFELDGQAVRYWAGTGPVTFTGTLDEFVVAYPAVVAEMVERGYLVPA